MHLAAIMHGPVSVHAESSLYYDVIPFKPPGSCAFDAHKTKAAISYEHSPEPVSGEWLFLKERVLKVSVNFRESQKKKQWGCQS